MGKVTNGPVVAAVVGGAVARTFARSLSSSLCFVSVCFFCVCLVAFEVEAGAELRTALPLPPRRYRSRNSIKGSNHVCRWRAA